MAKHRVFGVLVCTGVVAACNGPAESRDSASTLGTSMTAPATSDTGDDGSSGPTSTSDESETSVSSTMPSSESSTSGVDPSSGAMESTGVFGEPFMLSDPLIDGTMGTAVGGTFGADGWTVTGNADRIYWELPRLAEGSVEFTVTNMTLANLPLNDHEIFGLYEGGYDIEHPIPYNPEYRNNHYKSMIRIYGAAETKRAGQQKIMWGMCPAGAPGYNEDTPCPCGTEFFEEPFGGDPNWSGGPERLRVEWGGGFTRYLRNGAVVLEIDWSASGLVFGPDSLYVSLGTPRPLDVAEASMPVGAVFSDVVIEGVTGPFATCP